MVNKRCLICGKEQNTLVGNIWLSELEICSICNNKYKDEKIQFSKTHFGKKITKAILKEFKEIIENKEMIK